MSFKGTTLHDFKYVLFYAMFSLFIIIVESTLTCYVNICEELPMCENSSDYVFIDSLTEGRGKYNMYYMSTACDGKHNCDGNLIQSIRESICDNSRFQAIVSYQCISYHAFRPLTVKPTGQLNWRASINYYISREVCMGWVSLRIPLTTRISLKRFSISAENVVKDPLLSIELQPELLSLDRYKLSADISPGNIQFICPHLLPGSFLWIVLQDCSRQCSPVASLTASRSPSSDTLFTVDGVRLMNTSTCLNGQQISQSTTRNYLTLQVSQTTMKVTSNTKDSTEPNTPSTESKEKLWIIIGSVGGGLVLLVIVIACVLIKRSKTRATIPYTTETSQDASVVYANVTSEDITPVQSDFSTNEVTSNGRHAGEGALYNNVLGQTITYANVEQESNGDVITENSSHDVDYDSFDMALIGHTPNSDYYDHLARQAGLAPIIQQQNKPDDGTKLYDIPDTSGSEQFIRHEIHGDAEYAVVVRPKTDSNF